MKIGIIGAGKTKRGIIDSFLEFTKCLSESADEKIGVAFYRGVIYSYDEDVHILLLGSDIKGRFRLLEIVYDGSKFKKPVKGINNEKGVCQCIDKVLTSIEGLSTPISKIYFDFCENATISSAECFVYEDLDEVGSSVILLETDKSLVDVNMLKSAKGVCGRTLLCEGYSDVYCRLASFSGSKQEIAWFKERGVRVV